MAFPNNPFSQGASAQPPHFTNKGSQPPKHNPFLPVPATQNPFVQPSSLPHNNRPSPAHQNNNRGPRVGPPQQNTQPQYGKKPNSQPGSRLAGQPSVPMNTWHETGTSSHTMTNGIKRKGEPVQGAWTKRQAHPASVVSARGRGRGRGSFSNARGSGNRPNGFVDQNTSTWPTTQEATSNTDPVAEAANDAGAEAVDDGRPEILDDGGFASKIYAQLARDKIRAPKWPANPGHVSQKQVMADFRKKHQAYRDEARTSLIKAKLFDDPDAPKSLLDAIPFQGICEDMCPEWEKICRIVEQDVRLAEKRDHGGILVPDPELMVKRHARSAAGQETPLPMDVRSHGALRRCMDYMVDCLLAVDEDLPVRHHFIWDRTREVRTDFSRQKPSMGAEAMLDYVYCLELCVRFHVTSLHLLAGSDLIAENFSEQQEREQLGKSLQSLIETYEDCTKMKVDCDHEAEFRAYYILFFANAPGLMARVQRWGSKLNESKEVLLATSLVEALQNTSTPHGPLVPASPTEMALNAAPVFFTVVESSKVSYTMACFAEIHFNHVRQSCLEIIVQAYSRPKQGPKDITPDFLRRQLRFDSEEEAVKFAELHGLEFAQDMDTHYLVLTPRPRLRTANVPQSCSQDIVEKKRQNYSLPYVIRNAVYDDVAIDTPAEEYTDAATDTPAEEYTDDEDSLFVPDHPKKTGKADVKEDMATELESDQSPLPVMSTTSAITPDPTSKPEGVDTNVPTASVDNSAPLQTPGSVSQPWFGTAAATQPAPSIFSPSVPSTNHFAWTTTTPAQPVQSTDPALPVQSTNPFTWTTTTPAQPVQSTDPALPVQSTNPFTWTTMTTPAQPVQSTDPALPVQSTNPFTWTTTTPAQPVQSTNPSASAETPSSVSTTIPPSAQGHKDEGVTAVHTSSADPPPPSGLGNLFLFQAGSQTAEFTARSPLSQMPSTLPESSSEPSAQGTKPASILSGLVHQPFQGFGTATASTAATPAAPTSVSTPGAKSPKATTESMASLPTMLGKYAAPRSLFPRKPVAAMPSTPEMPLVPSNRVASPSESSRKRPAPAMEPPLPKDLMGAFTKWFVCGDKGLMEEQLAPMLVESILKKVFDDFKEEEKERKRKEEEEESWAEARNFRNYSLKVTYFYRWLNSCRKSRVIKRIRMVREKARIWNLPESAAKREAEEKAEQENRTKVGAELIKRRAREEVQRKKELQEAARAKKKKVEKALLATGIFSGVRDERAAAQAAARDESVDEEDWARPSQQSVLRAHELPGRKQSERPAAPSGSKTAMLRAACARNPMSLSTGSLRSSGLNTTLGSSHHSSRGHTSGVSKAKRVRVDPYWKLKANGVVEMPNGQYLHESVAIPMLEQGLDGPVKGGGRSHEPAVAPMPSPPRSVDQRPSLMFGGMRQPSGISSCPSTASVPKQAKRKRGPQLDDAEDDDLVSHGRPSASVGNKRSRSGKEPALDTEQLMAEINSLLEDAEKAVAEL